MKTAEFWDRKLAAVTWFAFALTVGLVFTGAILTDNNYPIGKTFELIGKWIGVSVTVFNFIMLLVYLFKKIIQ